MQRVLCTLFILTFLLNDISFAFENDAASLAVPTKFTSTEFQHAVQIIAGIKQALKELDTVDLDSLKSLSEKRITRRSIFSEQVEGVILFNAAEKVQLPSGNEYAGRDNYFVKATVNNMDYACQISVDKDGRSCEIFTVPYRIYVSAKTSGTVIVIADLVNEETRAVLNAYIDHEISGENSMAIDPWIAYRMSRGLYSVDEATAKKNPIYAHAGSFYSTRSHKRLIESAGRFLKASGTKNAVAILAAVESRPLVLISYKPSEDLPTITINGRSVNVSAHSSPFATYIFLPQTVFDEMAKSDIWPDAAAAYVEKVFIHEIGAICGLRVKVEENGDVVNVVDKTFEEYLRQLRPAALGLNPDFTRVLADLETVNLLDLEKRSDYAAGKVTDDRSLFVRTMLPILAAGTVMAAATATEADTAMTNKLVRQPSLSAMTSNTVAVLKKPASQASTNDPSNTQYIIDGKFWEKIGSREPKDRLDAVKLLGRIKGMDSARLLVKALDDEDISVRLQAAESLYDIALDDEDVIKYLVTVVADKSPTKSSFCTRILAKIGKKVLPHVLDSLKEKGYINQETRKNLLMYMSEYALDDIIAALSKENIHIPIRHLLEMLAQHGIEYAGPRTDFLLKLIRVNDQFIGDAVVKGFEQFGEKGIPLLIGLLGDKEDHVRKTAIKALGEMGAEEAIEPLKDIAGDKSEKNKELSEAAKEALEKIELKKKEKLNKKEPKKGTNGMAGASLSIERAEDAADILWLGGTGEIPDDELDTVLSTKLPPQFVRGQRFKEVRNAWTLNAAMVLYLIGRRTGHNNMPERHEIEKLAARIKEAEIEVYMPVSQLPNGAIRQFKIPLEKIFGDRLKVYQDVEGLKGMIKKPQNAVVMTVGLTEDDIGRLDKMGSELGRVRFMNFEEVDISAMRRDQGKVAYENYIAETLSMLIIARTITEEEAADKTSPMYRMFAHLLEEHMADDEEIDAYISKVADGSIDPISKLRYLLKNILKAIKIEAYKMMKPALEILWSA